MHRRFQRLLTIVAISLSLLSFVIAEDVVAYDDGASNERDLYLLIGQSNMAGRAPFGEDEANIIPRCDLLNAENKWEPAKNPLNRHSTIRKSLNMQKMNPGYLFAKTMLDKNKKAKIGLVVNAKGGTSITQWKKGTKFYKDAIARTKIAQQSGTLKGILWHQGESDAKDAAYLEKLKMLIDNLRTDLGEPDLPFVAGQVSRLPLINDQIAKLPATVPKTGFASSEGLTTYDRWHFDPKSMRLLGERYATEMLKLQTDAAANERRGASPDRR